MSDVNVSLCVSCFQMSKHLLFPFFLRLLTASTFRFFFKMTCLLFFMTWTLLYSVASLDVQIALLILFALSIKYEIMFNKNGIRILDGIWGLWRWHLCKRQNSQFFPSLNHIDNRNYNVMYKKAIEVMILFIKSRINGVIIIRCFMK